MRLPWTKPAAAPAAPTPSDAARTLAQHGRDKDRAFYRATCRELCRINNYPVPAPLEK
ncbi:hypothetical protein GTZ99_12360 [Novosphingobium sp. FSY-8]|uniref:Uncharacterized protein n=1 Tax=Novosphingobium ovatum TaxID=1908523 RepID=A0ABW9XFT1_9SPHN|nr:hypothetical protein [Novosphingobium ovatum]NBC37343.1 hypothetical protein [Novosphingobium ovatum]